MDRLIQGIAKFQRDVYPSHRVLFEKLAKGQDPKFLLIACSDSRVSLEWILQTGPGDVFVTRNAGNIVPPHGPTDAGIAAVEYGVAALNVPHIVVMGHSGCGAMKGLLNPAGLDAVPDVRSWVNISREARRSFDATGIDPNAPEALETLVKLNVRLQLDHLRTHPKVIAALQAGKLQLHGWYYEIGSGAVQVYDAGADRWVAVSAFYATEEVTHV